jgi:hypothetical protein
MLTGGRRAAALRTPLAAAIFYPLIWYRRQRTRLSTWSCMWRATRSMASVAGGAITHPEITTLEASRIYLWEKPYIGLHGLAFTDDTMWTNGQKHERV